MSQDGCLLSFVADEGRLVDTVGGAGNGDFDFGGIVEDFGGEFLDFGGHCGREHEGLSRSGELADNLHDVVVETHVKHAVGFVEDEEPDV